MNNNSIPLVVDLDGTLIKSDLLFETASALIIKSPAKLFHIIRLALSSRSLLKSYLAESVAIDPSLLPFNQEVIALLKDEKLKGRKIILATASNSIPANLTATHLNLFDEIFASEKNLNLKSHDKKQLLEIKFGKGGFDYIGNDYADIPIWKSARKAYLVSTSRQLISRVNRIGNLDAVIHSGKPPLLQPLIKSMRPHQWLKNLLIFIPLFAAQLYSNIPSILSAFLAFIAFGLTASSAYVLNDLVDINDDRRHPRKKFRPFAAGNISLIYGWVLWPTLLVAALLISFLSLPKAFVTVLTTYLFLTLAYSFILKRKVIVDALTLAALYTLRIIAGIYAIGVPLSFWLLSFSMFFFLSLALVKRFSEIKSIQSSEAHASLAGRGYYLEDLELVSSMGIGSGYISILVLALYIQDISSSHLYPHPEFIWLACPLLLFWISRIWLISHRGKMHDDPVFFAAKDKISWCSLAGLILLFFLARFF